MLKSKAIELLNEKVNICNKCEDLSSFRISKNYKHVPGTGNSNANILLIGEAPGENEAKQGIPFCGKSGNLLNNILKAAGWGRDEIFITNVVKCRPQNNREPSECEANNCRKFLEMQIKIIQPKWIVCLGRIASSYLLGQTGATLGELRGKVHNYNNISVICTYHPSYVLHSSSKEQQKIAKQAIWDDLQPIISSLRPKNEV